MTNCLLIYNVNESITHWNTMSARARVARILLESQYLWGRM